MLISLKKKEEQLDCLLYFIGHFTKCAVFCENMFDQRIFIEHQSATKNVAEVKAVKVIFASLNVLYIM